MLAASQQLRQMTLKPGKRVALALKIQAEAKRLHVQPALGVSEKPEQEQTATDKDPDGFQKVTTKKKKRAGAEPRAEAHPAHTPKSFMTPQPYQ
eukprot:4889529-Amphidinium_carterae.1